MNAEDNNNQSQITQDTLSCLPQKLIPWDMRHNFSQITRLAQKPKGNRMLVLCRQLPRPHTMALSHKAATVQVSYITYKLAQKLEWHSAECIPLPRPLMLQSCHYSNIYPPMPSIAVPNPNVTSFRLPPQSHGFFCGSYATFCEMKISPVVCA